MSRRVSRGKLQLGEKSDLLIGLDYKSSDRIIQQVDSHLKDL